jgi:hypothetical protein
MGHCFSGSKRAFTLAAHNGISLILSEHLCMYARYWNTPNTEGGNEKVWAQGHRICELAVQGGRCVGKWPAKGNLL